MWKRLKSRMAEDIFTPGFVEKRYLAAQLLHVLQVFL
jgi:hypothetical protein